MIKLNVTRQEAGHDAECTTHPNELENTQGCRDCRHFVFGACICRILDALDFGTRRSSRAGLLAGHQCRFRRAVLESGAVRRDCLSLVHRRIARPLGHREDRFFATVFLGSGLLFLGMLFTAAAIAGAILTAFVAAPEQLVNSATFHFARAAAYNIANIYMIKMAGVFMITTSTVAIYTAFAPRWLAVLGYFLSALLLLGSYYIRWSFVVFPLWVLLISISMLAKNLQRRAGFEA